MSTLICKRNEEDESGTYTLYCEICWDVMCSDATQDDIGWYLYNGIRCLCFECAAQKGKKGKKGNWPRENVLGACLLSQISTQAVFCRPCKCYHLGFGPCIGGKENTGEGGPT